MAISQAMLDFLLTNSVTDSRTWFEEHKEDYRRLVVAPLAELVTRLTPGMLAIDGGFITEPRIDRTISRIYRDMRIPQNRERGRYRANCWIMFARERKLYFGEPTFYLELDPAGYSYGMGYYQASTDTMRALRALILADEPATKKALTAFARQKTFSLEGERFKRPHYAEQPESKRDWLERRSISLLCQSQDFEQLFSENFADILLGQFQSIAPVYALFRAAEARRAANAPHGAGRGENTTF